MSDRAYEIAENLLGTKDSLRDHADRHELADMELMHEVREYALQCISCGVWAEPEEMDTTGDEPECEDCCGGA